MQKFPNWVHIWKNTNHIKLHVIECFLYLVREKVFQLISAQFSLAYRNESLGIKGKSNDFFYEKMG